MPIQKCVFNISDLTIHIHINQKVSKSYIYIEIQIMNAPAKHLRAVADVFSPIKTYERYRGGLK